MPADPSAPQAPDWLAEGYGHVWLPYTQMASVPPPLPVAATRGTRIVLADGRELIDGIASWWTACHGYNHPHIRAAVAAQLERMPHVMFGGLANEPALRLARRLADMLPQSTQPGVLLGVRLGRGGGRAQDGAAVLAQPGGSRAPPLRELPGRLSRRHLRRHVGVRSRGGHAQPLRRRAAGAARRAIARGRGGHRNLRRLPRPQ